MGLELCHRSFYDFNGCLHLYMLLLSAGFCYGHDSSQAPVLCWLIDSWDSCAHTPTDRLTRHRLLRKPVGIRGIALARLVKFWPLALSSTKESRKHLNPKP